MRNKKIYRTLLISLSFIGLSWLFSILNKHNYHVSELVQGMQKEFLKQEVNLDNYLSRCVISIESSINNSDISECLLDKFENEHFSLLITNKDSLVFWSTNSLPFSNIEFADSSKSFLIKTQNGYYYCKTHRCDSLTLYGFYKIFHQYSVENNYLRNSFSPDFNLPLSYQISTNVNNSDRVIFNKLGKPVFSVKGEEFYQKTLIPFWVIFCFFLLGSIYFLRFIYNVVNQIDISYFLKVPFTILMFLGVRFIQIKFYFPTFLYSQQFFSPVDFAWSNWLPSLGDAFLYFIPVFFLVLWLYNSFLKKKDGLSFRFNLFTGIVSIIALFLLYLAMFVFVQSFVLNSTLILGFNDILKMSSKDVVSLLLLVSISWILLCAFHVVLYIVKNHIHAKLSFAILVTSINLLTLVSILVFQQFSIEFLCLGIFTVIAVFIPETSVGTNRISGILFFVILGICLSQIISKNNVIKEHNSRILYSVKLSGEEDPIGEYLFADIAGRLKSDTVLQSLIIKSDFSEQEIHQYLTKNYFGNYFSKYHFQVTLCKGNDLLLIMPANLQTNCNDFFENLKNQYGKPTLTDDLFLIDDGTGKPTYLYSLVVKDSLSTEKNTKTLFIELISNPNIPVLGYPELLVGQNFRKTERYTYSYAKFFNDRLVYQYGEFNYPSVLSGLSLHSSNSYFSYLGYSHYVFHASNNSVVITSYQKTGILEKFADVSYFIILLIVALFVFNYFTTVVSQKRFFTLPSFKSRLQFITVAVIILSFIIAGFSSVNFFIRYYNTKNKEMLREKAYSVSLELQHKTGNMDSISEMDIDYISELLNRYSNIFFTEMNIFSIDGKLIASSRPQIFEQGLISRFMNPVALHSLKLNNENYFTNDESIGDLTFLSVYLPLKNNQNSTLAYLNIPYFAGTNELNREISGFLLTFINSYTPLIILSILMALAISGYLTRPLRLISARMRSLKPGIINEKIIWEKNDEIGQLIQEYNRMVDELALSTEQLMKSERESAWKEMAKQVAHEIKNPLTPMKLSLQNLMRAWNDKAPDYEQRLKKTSQTLIEQIDTLSDIASQFSTFAELQEVKKYPVHLVQIINDVIHLFSSDKYSLSVHFDDKKSYVALANETHLIQILNNIIKNAIQAIPENRFGQVEIRLSDNERFVVIEIEDNGNGIPDENKAKIFTPRFTSKTGGTGIGLSITKKLVDDLEGIISFRSEVSKGTVFQISLLKADENQIIE